MLLVEVSKLINNYLTTFDHVLYIAILPYDGSAEGSVQKH